KSPSVHNPWLAIPLFTSQHFLCVHDAVAQRDFEPVLPPVPDDALDEEEDSVKIVSLVKTKEPLGATIKKDKSSGAIVVARIMRGGPADKSGLIHEGDELKEVNGVSVEHRKPKEILPLLARSEGEIKFKIVPAFSQEENSAGFLPQLFVRTLFDYDPLDDPAIPCKDAAVAFQRGDVLEVVSMEDDTWWQARRLGDGDGDGRAGLIPSRQLHERWARSPVHPFTPRPVTVRPERSRSDRSLLVPAGESLCAAGLRRSFRLGRKSSLAREAARSRRWSAGVHGAMCPPTYVEVIPHPREPRDRRRLVVLVGTRPERFASHTVGRRLSLPSSVLPDTTRERRRHESEGVDYHFLSVHSFEEHILNQRFIEYGTYRGHYYGTSLDSVQRVMAEDKVCLLDVHPSNLKHVYSAEFKPFVVFVKPPRIEELRLTRRRAKFVCDDEESSPDEDFEDMIDEAETMESQFGQLFEKVIVNGDVATAFRELRAELEGLEDAAVQWLPAQWICPSHTESLEYKWQKVSISSTPLTQAHV
uniref:Membrane protein, palmitoylated 7b (MAGUK p55 subfamily member 7) n=1 Tax=Salarias fasciatus TaxID=181472 RepID=A0A672H8U0_SALFA